MNVGSFLLRGMLVGLLAGLLSFVFLKVMGEPAVDRAIAFETRMDEAKDVAARNIAMAQGTPMPAEDAQPELVSRTTQAGIGLFIGVVTYAVALGGLFALVCAAAHGRIGGGELSLRATALLVALSGLVALCLVPGLKYPANPPSVGDPATIGRRTALFFSTIGFSAAAMIAAWMLRERLVRRFGRWNASIVAAGAYGVATVVTFVILPTVDEVPQGFPAVLLWQFRVASVGAQIIVFTTLGIGFGMLAEYVRLRRAAAFKKA